MSDFTVNIDSRLDLSKARTELNNFVNKEHKIKLNLDLSGINGNKIGEQLQKSMQASLGNSFGKSYTSALQKQINEIAKTQRTAFSEPLKNISKYEQSYSDMYNKLLNKAPASYGQNKQLAALDEYLKQVEVRAQKAQEIQKKISQGFLEVESSSIGKTVRKYSGSDSSYFKELEQSYTKLLSLKKELTTGISDDGFSRTLYDKDFIEKYNQFYDVLTKCRNEAKVLNNEMSGAVKPLSNFEAVTAGNKTLSWLKNNSKAAKDYGESLKRLAELQKTTTDPVLAKDLQKQVNAIKAEASALGKTGMSFSADLKRGFSQIFQFATTYGIIQSLIRDIPRQMLQSVLDIDSAMTNLYKVTDETSKKYNEFLSNAGDTAKSLGRDISSYVEQTSSWAKLGYSIDESAELAKVSSIYANVGEVSDETAVSDIVTAMKAFNIEASNATTIIDQLNILGNEFATSSADLGEGLSKSASSMATAGTDMSKTLAMLTGGAEITQNAGEFGNFLKVASMRIRGMKGELEELGEDVDDSVDSISKVQTQILNLTHGEVNIFDDVGEFRDYYDIMEDIADVYDKLSSTEQASLSEILFGKQRGNQGAALLQAFQSGQIQKAYEATLDSAGSAQKEQDRWLESIEAKTAQFKATFQETSSLVLNSDLIKGIVDFGTVLLDLFNNIIDVGNGIPALLTAIGAVSFFKNLDWGKSSHAYFFRQSIFE